MKKSALFLITILFMVLSKAFTNAEVIYQNQETGFSAMIEDDAALFTDETKKVFTEEMISLTQYGNVCVKTVASNPMASSTDYANKYYDDTFGASADGTIFFIDMDHRELVLTSEGRVKKDVTSAFADSIMDNVYTYASEGKYEICCEKVFEQVQRLLEGKRIAEPMKYICNAFIAIILSILCNYGCVKLYTKKKKIEHPEFMLHTEEKFALTDLKVLDKKHYAAERTYSSRSSSSSYHSHSSGHSSSYSSGYHSSGGHSSSYHSSGGYSSHHSSGSHRF